MNKKFGKPIFTFLILNIVTKRWILHKLSWLSILLHVSNVSKICKYATHAHYKNKICILRVFVQALWIICEFSDRI